MAKTVTLSIVVNIQGDGENSTENLLSPYVSTPSPDWQIQGTSNTAIVAPATGNWLILPLTQSNPVGSATLSQTGSGDVGLVVAGNMPSVIPTSCACVTIVTTQASAFPLMVL